MSDILNKATVLVLNRNWQAINVRTPQDAFCQMATNVATGLEIASACPNEYLAACRTPHSALCTVHSDRPPGYLGRVDHVADPPQDEAVHTVRGPIRVPTVIVAVNLARVPKKRPKFCTRSIRERDGNRCQYTGRLLSPEEGSIDHIVPRSRAGTNSWENCVWASKEVNARKGNLLPTGPRSGLAPSL
jgi:5-methylcytosine-specific restriction endonuclease McrA